VFLETKDSRKQRDPIQERRQSLIEEKNQKAAHMKGKTDMLLWKTLLKGLEGNNFHWKTG
jgi:hypothetical protein